MKKKHFTFHHYKGAFCQGAFVLFPCPTVWLNLAYMMKPKDSMTVDADPMSD
jgi:hypothetical protein